MYLVELYPLKGTFKPGELAQFLIEIQSLADGEATVRLTIWHLAKKVASISQAVSLVRGNQMLIMEWFPSEEAPRGYGVVSELIDQSNQIISAASTAFDVLPDWTAFPRYGFLTDFTPGREDVEASLNALVRFHINGLQFYDWQYRHENLLAPADRFIDPLGRELSLVTVRDFIHTAHVYGMAVMPYLAVYAASLDFWRSHLDWALYDANGRALTFLDFLGLMDPSPGSPWISHLQGECARVLGELPFDGLHVDQYGDPMEGFNAKGDPIDLPTAFAMFVGALKTIHPNAAVTFNAVRNWPIEVLARATLDFLYIEVWPPRTGYLKLAETVVNARQISDGKPVVVALYIPADRIPNICLVDAMIFSAGGSRIELGERTRLLVDPYFPKHQAVSKELSVVLRKYYDFAVRYEDLLGPSAGYDPTIQINVLSGVWALARTSSRTLTICLVNLIDLSDSGWDRVHSAPVSLHDLPIRLHYLGHVRRVWWGSPDGDDLQLKQTIWRADHGTVQAFFPVLSYWGILVFELNDEEQG